ncbi:MAG: ribonuclease P protein component [Roseinatronobacter sp.]
MTPPGADVARLGAGAADMSAKVSGPPAVHLRPHRMPDTLRKRADFLRAAKARRVPCPAFLLQARRRDADEVADIHAARIGYTCSKKIGNAVSRNRAKRRLRAAARAVLPEHACAGWDYVLVGRPGATASHDFAAICADLISALEKLHGARRDGPEAGTIKAGTIKADTVKADIARPNGPTS